MKILVSYCASRSTHDRLLRARSHQDRRVLAEVDVHVDWAEEESPLRAPHSPFRASGYNLAAARNRCREFALHGGYDVLIPVDADCVIESLPAEWPPFGVALVRDYNGVADYRPAAWWCLRREVFAAHRWCEGFKGHGYEEKDFAENVCRDVPKTILSDFRCRHLPHPQALATNANAALFRSRQSTNSTEAK